MRALTAIILATSLLTAGCGSDRADVGTGDGGTTTSRPAPPATVPASVPDLVGTITDVTPFVPVTDDCVPPEDLDPDGVTSSDDPPVCTPEDSDLLGTILVEEQPEAASAGRKVSYSVTAASVLAGVDGFDDLEAGQRVETWAAGACAESYPEQCGLLALRLAG